MLVYKFKYLGVKIYSINNNYKKMKIRTTRANKRYYALINQTFSLNDIF